VAEPRQIRARWNIASFIFFVIAFGLIATGSDQALTVVLIGLVLSQEGEIRAVRKLLEGS